MSLPPPPSYTSGPLSYVAPAAGAAPASAKPGSVVLARVTALVALIGGVISSLGFVLWSIADTADSTYADTGTFVAITVLCVIQVSLTAAAPWGSLIGTAGYSGGRAVAWVFGPLAFLVSLGSVTSGVAVAVGAARLPVPVRIFSGIGAVAAAISMLALVVTCVAWVIPGARRYLATHRRPGRERRGKVTAIVAAVLSGLTVVLYGATLVFLFHGADNVVPPRYADIYDDVSPYFTGAIILVIALTVLELAVLAGTLVTAFAARWWVRAVAFAVGHVVLFAGLGGTYLLGILESEARSNSAGRVSEDAAFVAFFVYLPTLLLTIVTLLAFAMPSISARVDAQRASRSSDALAGRAGSR